MNASSLLLVALGGALGSVCRALAGAWIPAGRLPWGTLLVNIAGSLLIGYLVARWVTPETASGARVQAFWIVGFCGGFTTFSAFSWQTIDQLLKGEWLPAALNVVLSVALCLAATWLGWRIGRALA